METTDNDKTFICKNCLNDCTTWQGDKDSLFCDAFLGRDKCCTNPNLNHSDACVIHKGKCNVCDFWQYKNVIDEEEVQKAQRIRIIQIKELQEALMGVNIVQCFKIAEVFDKTLNAQKQEILDAIEKDLDTRLDRWVEVPLLAFKEFKESFNKPQVKK